VRRINLFMDNPEEAARRGRAGREALRSRQGVSQQVAEIIVDFVGKDSGKNR